jgi:hypothetical protein
VARKDNALSHHFHQAFQGFASYTNPVLKGTTVKEKQWSYVPTYFIYDPETFRLAQSKQPKNIYDCSLPPATL